MDVQSSRTTRTPGGEVDVSRTGEGAGDQVRHLLRWSKGSRLGSTVEHVTDGIVTCYPVTTANLMVTIRVSHGMAFRAGIGSAVEWPVPEAGAKLLVTEDRRPRAAEAHRSTSLQHGVLALGAPPSMPLLPSWPLCVSQTLVGMMLGCEPESGARRVKPHPFPHTPHPFPHSGVCGKGCGLRDYINII